MKATLKFEKFEIECGEKTCAYDQGAKCCKFWSLINHAFSHGKCRFFGNLPLEKVGLEYWSMRHPDCLKRAEGNE